MNRLSLKMLLTFGLVVYVNGESKIQRSSSPTGYSYEKPVNGLEIPVVDQEETPTEKTPEEEEIVTEEQDDENHGSDLEYLEPREKVYEKEETLESDEGVVKTRKREFKNDGIHKNSDGESDIPLKRKDNLHRSYSQGSGDNLKRKPVTGSKQKKIRQRRL